MVSDLLGSNFTGGAFKKKAYLKTRNYWSRVQVSAQ